MHIARFTKSFTETRGENKFLRILVAVLIAGILWVTFSSANKDQVIMLVPPTLAEKGWVSSTQSSAEVANAWVLYVAMLLGNVTPANAGIVKDALGPILAADIQREVMEALDVQIQQIRADKISLAFEPERIVRDESNDNRFYVTGRATSEGPTGEKKRTVRTYEMDFAIEGYRPTISWINTYGSTPRTSDVVAREQAREETRQRREL